MTRRAKDSPEVRAKKLKNLKKFTSEYQPSPERKSEGAKKRWEYARARQCFYEAMCEIELPDGTKQNFWDLVRKKLQIMILDKKSPLSEKDKAKLMTTLCKEFMPEVSKLELTGANGKDLSPPQIIIQPVKADTDENKDS